METSDHNQIAVFESCLREFSKLSDRLCPTNPLGSEIDDSVGDQMFRSGVIRVDRQIERNSQSPSGPREEHQQAEAVGSDAQILSEQVTN